MAEYQWVQDVFSRGELAPAMYSRISTQAYFKGLKRAKNVLPTPQGGARKRFGTEFDATLTQTDYTQIYPVCFEYLNECIYQVIFYNNAIDIYLEGSLVATVGSTGIDSTDIQLIDEIILQNNLAITVGFQQQRYLSRGSSSPVAITAVDTVNNILTVATVYTVGLVLPIQFTTSGSLPTSNPQIKVGRVYFMRALSANTIAIFTSAVDAGDNLNRITFSAAGATSSIVPLNSWTFANVPLKNLPVYDFDGGYDALTFTPGATTGSTTLTASGPIFTAAMIGGLYFGGGGSARITAFSSSTVVTILVIDDFSSTSAISGMLSLLTEPAWSDVRGWPKVCGSYQNRAIYANTDSLPNGIWCSVINDYEDFDDSSLDADMAISWYPTSDVNNEIDFITPYRSLIVHTDAGVYSTPFQADIPITPATFSLSLQDSTPTANIQPVSLDNQLMIVSGIDVNSLLWEFGQSSYVPNLISAPSAHLITSPYWLAPFRDRNTIGGRYLFVVNRTGTIAMFQTLLSEEIAGWTWAQTEQSYGTANFRQIISSVIGRCWFIVERSQASAGTTISITAIDTVNNTMTAIASNFSLTVPTAVLFSTLSTLPTTAPQIQTGIYYFVLGVDANTFKVYASQDDALADINQFTISALGASSSVTPYNLTTVLNLEELSFDVKTDNATVQTGVNITSVSGLDRFNGQTVTIKGDGRVWDSNPVVNGEVAITLQGKPASVSTVEVGLTINYEFAPLALSIPTNGDPRTSNLAQAKHVRNVNVMLVDSVGGKINGTNIAYKRLNQTPFAAPTPQTALIENGLMSGWNRWEEPQFVITQSEPYDFNVIGLFYKLEV